jgi:hypothetical protein
MQKMKVWFPMVPLPGSTTPYEDFADPSARNNPTETDCRHQARFLQLTIIGSVAADPN